MRFVCGLSNSTLDMLCLGSNLIQSLFHLPSRMNDKWINNQILKLLFRSGNRERKLATATILNYMVMERGKKNMITMAKHIIVPCRGRHHRHQCWLGLLPTFSERLSNNNKEKRILEILPILDAYPSAAMNITQHYLRLSLRNRIIFFNYCAHSLCRCPALSLSQQT